jgi:hypothetical protein
MLFSIKLAQTASHYFAIHVNSNYHINSAL